jgi:hypothetical protein
MSVIWDLEIQEPAAWCVKGKNLQVDVWKVWSSIRAVRARSVIVIDTSHVRQIRAVCGARVSPKTGDVGYPGRALTSFAIRVFGSWHKLVAYHFVARSIARPRVLTRE